MGIEQLKYLSSERYVEGIITEVKSGLVGIDLKGRMGSFRIPVRMLITEYELKPGLEVGFMLSYPEVLGPEINDKYAQNCAKEIKNMEE